MGAFEMRELEFRAWDDEKLSMVRAVLFENESSRIIDARGFELMQFTGLRDKNGVKIFEGDIMQWHGDDSTVAVKWEQGTCSYTAFGRLCAMHLKPDESGDGHLLVIGNIYETPELLK
jgi:uncharacterized phage protein (TIGR01671 family)